VNVPSVIFNDTCTIGSLTIDRTSLSGTGDIVLNNCTINTGSGAEFVSPFRTDSNMISLTMIGGSIKGQTLDRSISLHTASNTLKLKGVYIKMNACKIFSIYKPLELIDCDIVLTEDVGYTSAANIFSTSSGSSLKMRNCNWKYIGDGTPTMFLGGASFAHLSNNVFESTKNTYQLNLPPNSIEVGSVNLVNGKFYLSDPSYRKSTEPTSGYFNIGQIVFNNSPISGGYVGWVCTTGGTANNTAWVASTAYIVGQQVYANNKVYQCTVAGTSGSTAPSHSTGTVTDGTVTWQYVDVKAVFKQYGLIQ
jgi:hypothetical protein